MKVGPSGMNINANLTFAGYHATNLGAAAFTAGPAVATVRSLYADASGDLYWVSGAGTPVQVTDGNSPNIIVGGIGGDYVAVGAAFNYDSATARYTAKQPGNLLYARVAAGEVRIHEHGSGSSAHVALACPAALGSSYTLTFPSAVPVSTAIAQVSSAGAVTFSNTIANAVTFSGEVTFSSDVNHADRTLAMNALSGSGTNWNPDTDGCMAVSGAGVLLVPIDLHVGDRIKAVSFQLIGDGAADVTVNVYSLSGAMVRSTIGTVTVTNQAASWTLHTLDVTDTTVVSGGGLFIAFDANAANPRVGNIGITYDRP